MQLQQMQTAGTISLHAILIHLNLHSNSVIWQPPFLFSVHYDSTIDKTEATICYTIQRSGLLNPQLQLDSSSKLYSLLGIHTIWEVKKCIIDNWKAFRGKLWCQERGQIAWWQACLCTWQMLYQLLMTNLSMVGTMSNNSYTTDVKAVHFIFIFDYFLLFITLAPPLHDHKIFQTGKLLYFGSFPAISYCLFWSQSQYRSVPLICPLRKYAPPLFTAKVPA